jgi:hypothetical protein
MFDNRMLEAWYGHLARANLYDLDLIDVATGESTPLKEAFSRRKTPAFDLREGQCLYGVRDSDSFAMRYLDFNDEVELDRFIPLFDEFDEQLKSFARVEPRLLLGIRAEHSQIDSIWEWAGALGIAPLPEVCQVAIMQIIFQAKLDLGRPTSATSETLVRSPATS